MKTTKVCTLILISIILVCCNNRSQKEEIQEIEKEWIGKTIEFPEKVTVYSINNDTTPVILSAPYRILVYTDTTGCTGCNLNLHIWKHFMNEADSLFKEEIDFLFYFQPKDEEELKYLLKANDFKEKVFIDRFSELNNLNHLPSSLDFQCFLLDKNNIVLSIGNPTLNPQKWNAYRDIFTQNGENGKKKKTTAISIDNDKIDIKGLVQKEKKRVKFKIKNIGNTPLIITNINSACGCTIPSWEKKPINPNRETEIIVEVTPDNKGYFRKSVTLFCNTEEQIHILTVSGMVEN